MSINPTRIVVGLVAFLLMGTSLDWAKNPGLPFSNDLEATLQIAKASRKPVVVAFVAAWCPVCRQMRQETFADPAVLALVDEFLWVMVDIDRNLSTAREYGVEGVPLVYVLAPEGQTRARIVGLQAPTDFHARLAVLRDTRERSPEATPIELAPLDTGPNSGLIWKPTGYRGEGVCFSHVGYGPLKLYSQSPFQSLRMVMRPRTPSTVAKGQFEFGATATWVNIWGVEKTVNDPTNAWFLDAEMLQTSVALAYGISDTLEIEGELQNRSRFGGVMDGFIQGFHDLFGIDQNGRDEVPRDDFFIQLNPPEGASVQLGDSERGDYSRTLQLSVQHNVTCGTSRLPAFSYSLSARLETLDAGDLSGGGDLDFGASVALARRFGRFYVYGTLGHAWFGRVAATTTPF
jgi:thiol-disulfide isomerase/thioredoxin